MNAPAAVTFTPDLAGALGLCAAAFDAADRIAWRSPALPPGLTSESASGLKEALAAARAADGPVEALVSLGERRVFDARLGLGEDGLVHALFEDAAERHAAQQRSLEDRERLLLTSRILSVGEMAAMLAHELNQPVGAVTNLVRGLKLRLDRGTLSPEDTGEALQKAAEQALYAAGVIARIRTFVDQRAPRVEQLDLARLAEATLDLLDWELRRDGVRTGIALQPGLPPVLGDAVMIQQVLVNLARNGLEAMRGAAQRVLTVSARANAAGEVVLSVADTGPGVSPEAAERLFQPFHTTKPEGMGVGLGVCRSIVELHAGRLWFSNNPGGGSTFHLALPAAQAQETAP